MAQPSELFTTKEQKEKVILVGVDTGRSLLPVESSLLELEELMDTAGGEVVGALIQKREGVHPKHYLGKGKVEELKELLEIEEATGIVCDDELSPAQMKNLEEMLQVKVMDRTMVILDIFAARAKTREGKIQVELAQLRYQLTRLTGSFTSLSRLGGGIGTRGPGEKKLEVDRRYMQNRITSLRHDLEEIETHRRLLRSRRKKNGVPVAALVGYTNAGKSTLLNQLTASQVLAENQLFATLDITTKKCVLPGGMQILFSDTVGFIQKLPHHLIQAFRATLEETREADLLLHVVDATSPRRLEQMYVVYETLHRLGCDHIPVVTLWNKMDCQTEYPLPKDHRAQVNLSISAATGIGCATLLQSIETMLQSMGVVKKIFLPYAESFLMQKYYGLFEVLNKKETNDGIFLEIYTDPQTAEKLKKYWISNEFS